jgi:tetratricopeptide (TPR) repeat protein
MNVGDVIADRFVVERLAGVGGMSTVFQASDLLTGEAVALKVLRTSSRESPERLFLEARLLADLHHPAIARHIAHGVTRSGEAYVVLEWLSGEDLRARLARRGLTVAEAVLVGLRVASALSAIHALGAVHRDVKPSNVFLVDGEPSRATLFDFGLARGGGEDTLSRAGTVLGTPGYMAPEQARGLASVGPPADIFSLGCVLYACLSGQPPYRGDDPAAVLARLLLEPPPSIGKVRPDLDPELEELVTRMLAPDPRARPAEARNVEQALERILERATALPSAVIRAKTPELTDFEQRFPCIVLVPDTADADELRKLASIYGGRVEPLAEYGALAVTLLGDGTATDQATQAARCALALADALHGLPMAIATGRIDVSARLPSGAALDRAHTLLQSARASVPKIGDHGGRAPALAKARAAERSEPRIALDEVTAALLEPRFRIDRDERGLVLGAPHPSSFTGRRLLGKLTPCVGREAELAILEGVFRECETRSVSRVALLTAPAGYGKSRVRDEFLARVASDGATEVLLGRGDPLSAGSPFAILGQALRQSAGILDGEPEEVRRDKLLRRVQRRARAHDGHAAQESQRIADFLGELIGVRYPETGNLALRAARQDAVVLGDQMRRAFIDFLLTETGTKPVILVLEDLHWGDLPTVKLIEAALKALDDRPFMVLAVARPSVFEQFPRLWEGVCGERAESGERREQKVTSLRLGELSRKASRHLVRTVLGPSADPELTEAVVERAAGNALYLEELIRAVSRGDSELPETVLAMVEARLKAQEPEARRLLRAASIFGQTFWRGGLVELTGGVAREDQVDAWLDELVERELVTRRPTAKFPAEGEFSFRHALVREAAYAMLTDADRELGHRLAGAWLENAGERDAIVLAKHYLQGGMRERAAESYLRAGAQAIEANDFLAAAAHVDEGLACTTDPSTSGRLELVRAEALQWRGEIGSAHAAVTSAVTRFSPGSDDWCRTVDRLIATSVMLGEHEETALWLERFAALHGALADDGTVLSEALRTTASKLVLPALTVGRPELAERLLALTDRDASELDSALMVGFRERAWAFFKMFHEQDRGAYVTRSEAAVLAFDAAGALRQACLQRGYLGHAYAQIGFYDLAEPLLERTVVEADAMKLENIAAAARHNLGAIENRRGRFEEAAELEREAIDAFVRMGDRRLEGYARIYLAEALIGLGAWEDAERAARAAIGTLAPYPPLEPYARAVHAAALLAGGLVDDALDAASEAVVRASALGGVEEGEAFLHLVHAEALRAKGHDLAAYRALVAARAWVLDCAAKITELPHRRSYLEAVPEHARIFRLAAEWAAGAA